MARKKTKAQIKAQYNRIKSRLNDLDSTRYIEYDTPTNRYTTDLENSMIRRSFRKNRIKNVAGKAANRLVIQSIRSARSENRRLNTMADTAYNNMMKSFAKG